MDDGSTSPPTGRRESFPGMADSARAIGIADYCRSLIRLCGEYAGSGQSRCSEDGTNTNDKSRSGSSTSREPETLRLDQVRHESHE